MPGGMGAALGEVDSSDMAGAPGEVGGCGQVRAGHGRHACGRGKAGRIGSACVLTLHPADAALMARRLVNHFQPEAG
jgi:hypothetical protein